MDTSAERCYRPLAFDKMEGLVREMQDPENGVPVRSQKLFLTSIPSAFMGYDLIEWLMERLGIEESAEALNIANQMCQYGYFFPVSDSKNLVVKDDSSLYRFQPPYYWPWQQRTPDNVEYAIYLAKRTLRNKQRHGLEEYELEALTNLRKNLQNKWDFITLQAEEQVKLAKERKKGDKIVSDSQERAYWRVYRPPPGFVSSLEQCPVPNRPRNGTRQRRRTLEDCRREVDLLKNSLSRTRIKVSQALDGMLQYVDTYAEYDPLISGTQPSNPWVSEDLTYWQLNSPMVEMPTEKRVRRWGLSMEELVSDPTGLHEFTAYLRKEYSHENIRFWMEVNVLRRSSQSQIHRKVSEIFEEFLAPGAPCEINIDGKTMEKVHQELKQPSRFTFDAAAEHVYTLLLKKDCYPRFIRSEHYKSLVASGIQPSHKKRFFGFGPTKKKTSTTSAPNPTLLQQQQQTQGTAVGCGALSRRRGSDRSLSGSAHELAISGVRDSSRVPHSHSQSNLSDIPYRGDLPCQNIKRPISTWQNLEPEPAQSCGICPWDEPTPASESEVQTRVKKPSIAINPGASTSEDICPWEQTPPAPASTSEGTAPSTSAEKGDKQLEKIAEKSESGSERGDKSPGCVSGTDDRASASSSERSPNKPVSLQRMSTSSVEQMAERPTTFLDISPGAATSFERISVERIPGIAVPSEMSPGTFDRTPGSTERLLQRSSDRHMERPTGFDRTAEHTAERIAERVSERNAERSRQAAAALDKSTEKLSDKGLEVRSRKNSAQFDSGSSSSDISLAIAEVSDRFRRNYGLATQLTLDGDNRSKKLSTTSYEVRRASVSIPTKFSSSSSSNEGRPSVSSFEDVTVNSIDNSSKALKKSQSLIKTNSVTGISAPIISVSSIVDDVIVDLEEPTGCYKESSTMVIMAPLAVPDSESPCSEIAPELPEEEPNLTPLIVEPDEETDGRAEDEAIAVPLAEDSEDRGVTSDDKDICPWEDE